MEVEVQLFPRETGFLDKLASLGMIVLRGERGFDHYLDSKFNRSFSTLILFVIGFQRFYKS
jgi:hypothetical protein